MSEIKMISKKKRRNRKRKKIIFAITITAVIIIILVVVALFLNLNSKSDKEQQNTNNSVYEYKEPEEVFENTESNSNQESLTTEVPTQDNLDINKINGFTVGEEHNLELPYSIPNTPLVIESIGSYSGPFVEDGSNSPIENIVSMVIKNDSEVMAQYGEIKIKIDDSKEVEFKVTNLPAKTSALVIESTGSVQFVSGSKYECEDSTYAELNGEATLMEDKIKIGTDNQRIIIKNISSEDLGTVYVYYKYVHEGGVYLGGITFRAKFENVTAGSQVEAKAGHFSKEGSSIMMVDSIKSE